jgi:hypothetical protein
MVTEKLMPLSLLSGRQHYQEFTMKAGSIDVAAQHMVAEKLLHFSLNQATLLLESPVIQLSLLH